MTNVATAKGGYMHSDPVYLASGIGNDFESWEYAYECALKLPYHSAASFTGVVTQAAYEKVPVSYIYTEKDLIVSPGKPYFEVQSKLVLISIQSFKQSISL